MAALCHPWINLAAGKLAALAGLRALRHLDLDLLGGNQIFAGNAEPGGGDLLDGRIPFGAVAFLVLAALAGVGLAAQTVHGNGKAFMGFLGQRAVAHGGGLEALDDGVYVLYFLDGDAGFGVVEFQQAAQVHIVAALIGRGGGVLLELAVVPRPDRLLQKVDSLGIVQVLLRRASAAEFVGTHAGQIHVNVQPQRVERLLVAVFHVLLDIVDGDAAHPADGVGEVFVNDLFADAHRFKNLAALIGLDGGNAHLGGDLHDTRQHRLVVIVDGGVKILFQQPVADQIADALLRQIRVDGAGAEAQKRGKIMDKPGFAAFQNQRHGGALAGANQIFGHRADGQQTGNGDMILVNVPIGQNQDVRAVPISPVNVHEQPVDGLFQRGVFVVANGHGLHLETGNVHGLDFQQVRLREDGVVDFQNLAVFRVLLQQITLCAHVYSGGCNDFLPQCVDGRVRNLGKHLLEILEQRRAGVAENSQRSIAAHRAGGFRAIFRHGEHDGLQILVAVAEGLLEPHHFFSGVGGYLPVGHRQVGEVHQIPVQPFAVGLAAGVLRFQVFIVHQLALHGIHQQHLAGAQAVLADDVLLRDVQNAHLAGKDQPSVVGNVIAAGTQTVAVKDRAHHVAVAEQNGRGAVPRLQHGSIILVKVLLLLIHVPVVAPRLRDGDHHRQRQVHAVHDHEFQRVIQHGGVGTALIDNRQHLGHIVL